MKAFLRKSTIKMKEVKIVELVEFHFFTGIRI